MKYAKLEVSFHYSTPWPYLLRVWTMAFDPEALPAMVIFAGQPFFKTCDKPPAYHQFRGEPTRRQRFEIEHARAFAACDGPLVSPEKLKAKAAHDAERLAKLNAAIGSNRSC